MITKKPNRFVALYSKLAAFSVESLFVRKRPPGPKRTVFVNKDIPQEYWDHKKKKVKREHVYTSNQVITSKYTILTFLPRNLLEQFRRIANVFFLGIAILQFFPKFSTISPGLVLLPLLIVLTITAGKDAYEDVKRHQSDRRVNYSTIRVLQGGDWRNHNAMQPKTKTFLRAILPKRFKQSDEKPNTGDLEKAETVGRGSTANAPEGPRPTIPDDIEFDENEVPQHDSEQHHHRLGLLHHDHHMKTPHWKKTLWEDVRVGDIVKIYDNESIPADVLICSTSEEENEAYVETKNLDGETNLKSRRAVPSLVHLSSAKACAKPENHFQVGLDSPENNMFRLNAAVQLDGRQEPADISMILLRGTVLRNTAWIIGVVLFTGEDTKIVQNSGGTPSKRSKVERQMNPQVFLNLILLAGMAVACGIVDSILEQRYYDQGAPWLFGANTKDDNPKINGLVTWAFALITFQNIVPISLYISIEAVRTVQAAFIFFDTNIYYEKTKQATLARSWNLSDDLGQIEYIFSDKTGTLTQNSMIFRQCSIGGRVYIGEPDTEKESETPDDTSVSASTQSPPTNTNPTTVNKHPVFRSPDLVTDIRESLNTKPDSLSATHARMLNGFFTVLGLCHTVLTSEDKETGKIEYKAQSPDEAALVRAAADAGYAFRGRDREILYLQTPMSEEQYQQRSRSHPGSESGISSKNDRYEKYELLNILEFTSTRKRMSVVVRKLDQEENRVFLLMKGADNVIFERLKPGVDVSLREQTEMHLSEFASNGLRTLTLAYKIIPDEEYELWTEKYHEASVSLDNREEKVEAVAEELERDVRLLGATAIEDSLQDGVPETIHDLKRAGIKIWVATGDKLETAIAIGHSTNLIGRESNIIVIRGGEDGARTVYEQMIKAAEDFFPETSILQEHDEMFGTENSHQDVAPGDHHHQQRRHSLRRLETGVSSIVGSNNGDRPGGFILVIDGAALTHALSDDIHKDLILRLAMHCEGVICCRVSPLQKALVVRLVKDGLGAMTLAIGDGANDVSMIQAADVGVGISGEEGLQAVNASDYAIAQFRFLKRLILVHGHWSYARNGNMILNFFYKNIVCIGVLWWFQIYCGWSSAYAFEYTYLLFWNSFWTIAPPIAIGIFDRIVDDHVLMDLPELYRFGRESRWFGMKWFVLYVLDAVYQSAVVFFFIKYTYMTPTTRLDGYGINLIEMTTPMVFAAVTAADLFNGMNTNVWTSWVFFAVFIGIILLWAYTPIYALISPGWFATPVFGNYDILFTSAYFYLTIPITVCLALLPRFSAKAYKFIWKPDDIDIMRWARKVDPHKSDYSKDVFMSGLEGMRGHRRSYGHGAREASDAHSRRSVDSLASNPPHSHSHSHSRPALLPHQSSVSVSASRTDMSTGIRSVHRGFDFHTEEGGVSMRRMQSNLSSRRNLSQIPGQSQSSRPERPRSKGEGIGRVLSASKSLLKRKPHHPPS
ncbi:hypothetical protein E1B28_009257 [Marasmius oreades]|uniref:Phospholipid-transporting ATPase n=1 Tax=Marasmius oreades TaxID=181124 RepID=A0A9P7S0A4_9AGAR|nr:uncharacterized protein E1B28_009257 [Marasmius oreades]KAG7092955.1 hypothetical protein E1B28_009257 [Marasmius oreades]